MASSISITNRESKRVTLAESLFSLVFSLAFNNLKPAELQFTRLKHVE